MGKEIAADLSEEELARVRELGAKLGLTVEEMLKAIIRKGLPVEEARLLRPPGTSTREELLEALSETMTCQSRVARAEAALTRVRRDADLAVARLARLARNVDAGVEVPPEVAAALGIAHASGVTGAAEDPPSGSLRARILAVMQMRPDDVWTPALVATAIGYEKRDSIRNTLLVLAARGKIDKCGEGQYQARKKQVPAERTVPNVDG